MSLEPLLPLAVWLLRVVLGGGFVLLAAALLVRLLRQPARRQCAAEWGVAAALLLVPLCLAPGWLAISLPALPSARSAPVEPVPPHLPEDRIIRAELPPDDVREQPILADPEFLEPPPARIGRVAEVEEVEEPRSASLPATATTASSAYDLSESLAVLIVCLYLAGIIYFLGRFVWGCVQLHRFLVSTSPAPEEVEAVLTEMTLDGVDARLRVSSRLRVPVSCGLLRPTIVLPVSLCDPTHDAELRWVLAHELAHLRRRDARTTLLFALARAFYFALPWFWWLRRQTQLCQEYVADAAAAEIGPVEDYAEFLLRWSTAPPIPAGATGVSGHASDLFRRVTMLVRNPVKIEERCPRRWSLPTATLLLSLAVGAAGVGLSRAVADDTKKANAPAPRDVTKEPAKKEEPKPEKKEGRKVQPPVPGLPDIEDLLKRLPGGLDADTLRLIRQQMEETRKILQQLQQVPGGGIIPFPQIPQFQVPLNRRNRIPPSQGMPEPRLGALLTKPSSAIVDQLDLPRDQGLVVEELKDDAAGAKGGLKRHDILLELDGKPVSSDLQEFNKQLASVRSDKAIDAIVLRKSKKETIKGLKLPEAKQQPEKRTPFRLQFNPFGGLGNGFGNGGFPGIGGGMMTVNRLKDSFTAKDQDAGVTVAVKGTIDAGKARVREIIVNDGDKTQTYPSADKVPEAHREKVQALTQASEQGRVRNYRLNR